ncbi:hypothetical protein F4818DRAFT_416354 [Hypoxylon cercidicola]|nr:hypothetical protein F4818DRAFT_416354 [Hypoxylon cercidicola]
MAFKSWYCCRCNNGPLLISGHQWCAVCGHGMCIGCDKWPEHSEQHIPADGYSEQDIPSDTYGEQDIPTDRYSEDAADRWTTMDADASYPPGSPTYLQPYGKAGIPRITTTSDDHLRDSNISSSLGSSRDFSHPSAPSSQVIAEAIEDRQATKGSGFSAEALMTPIKHELKIAPQLPPPLDGNSRDATTGSGNEDIEQPSEKSGEIAFELHSFRATMLSRWLESLQDDPNYAIIAQACENILQNQPTDGDETSQIARAPSGSTPNSQSTKARSKRKASDINGDNDDSSVALSTATEAPSKKRRRKSKFACHFYKMNQHLYVVCGNNGYGTISHLAEHLRKEHGLNERSCRVCWMSFSDPEALAAHNRGTGSMVCRATGGTPICELRIPKTRIGDYDRWFWIWKALFPRFQKPESPYWESLNSVEQYYTGLRQSLLAQLMQTHSPRVVEEVMNSFTRYHENWITNPPEPRLFIPMPMPAETASSGAINGQMVVNTYQPSDAVRSQVQAGAPNHFRTDAYDPTLSSEAISNHAHFDIRPQQSVERDPVASPKSNTDPTDFEEHMSFAELFPAIEPFGY